MKTIRPLLERRGLIVADVAATVAEASRIMKDHGIGALPVLDGNRLAGIVTERDVVWRVVAAGLDPAAAPLRTVMSTDLVVADVGDSHQTCLHRMQQGHVRHLLVLDGGGLAGILSIRDLLAVELDERGETIQLLNAYVHDIPATLTPARAGT